MDQSLQLEGRQFELWVSLICIVSSHRYITICVDHNLTYLTKRVKVLDPDTTCLSKHVTRPNIHKPFDKKIMFDSPKHNPFQPIIVNLCFSTNEGATIYNNQPPIGWSWHQIILSDCKAEISLSLCEKGKPTNPIRISFPVKPKNKS